MYLKKIWVSSFFDNSVHSCLLIIFCDLCFQEFAGEDDSDLFLEEREATLRQAEEEKRKIQASVPGILNPHEINEGMED